MCSLGNSCSEKCRRAEPHPPPDVGAAFQEKKGEIPLVFESANNSLLQGGASEVQEEPVGLFSYHLPKDITWWNFSAWAPVLGWGACPQRQSSPAPRHLVLWTHDVHTAIHDIPNLCWNNPYENQRSLRLTLCQSWCHCFSIL